MSVSLVNCFEVPAGREEEFFNLWREVNDYMRAQPGYLGHKLYRAIGPDASFRFVNVANWASPAHFKASHSEEFRRLISRPAWTAFPSRPGLYEVAHDGEAAASASAT